MRLSQHLCHAAGAGLLLVAGSLLLAACQQPYRVFAVQLASASAMPASMPAAAALPRASAPARPPAPASARLTISHREPFDLNRASRALLRSLPGMDATTLQHLLAGRPYRAKRDLLRRTILTPAQYARWKSFLVVHRAPPPAPRLPHAHPRPPRHSRPGS